jgi:hypothetical protein
MARLVDEKRVWLLTFFSSLPFQFPQSGVKNVLDEKDIYCQIYVLWISDER